MQNKFRVFLKSFVISLMCCSVLVGVGYFYLEKSFEPAQNEVEKVPYKQQAPDSAGLLFEMNGDSIFIYLDFSNEIITLSLALNDATENMIYGYPIDYTVKTSEKVLINSIDYIDGIDLDTDFGILRHTGTEVCLKLQKDNSHNFKRILIEKICEKISQSGVAVDFFADIIENSETNLKLPDCYFWAENFQELCCNIRFID